MFQGVADCECSCAVQLDCLVDDVLGALGCEQLRHRGQSRPISRGSAAVICGGRGPHQQPGRLQTGCHLGERVHDGLLVGQVPAIDLAPLGPRHRQVEGRLGHPDGEGAYAGAEEVQSAHGDGETAVHAA
jgi:hypothetical protein